MHKRCTHRPLLERPAAVTVPAQRPTHDCYAHAADVTGDGTWHCAACGRRLYEA